MQIIKLIFELPLKEDYITLVNLEFLNGIWVLYLSIRADIQCPKQESEPFMHVNSCILSSLSSTDISWDILNFSEPAKSTILSFSFI